MTSAGPQPTPGRSTPAVSGRDVSAERRIVLHGHDFLATIGSEDVASDGSLTLRLGEVLAPIAPTGSWCDEPSLMPFRPAIPPDKHLPRARAGERYRSSKRIGVAAGLRMGVRARGQARRHAVAGCAHDRAGIDRQGDRHLCRSARVDGCTSIEGSACRSGDRAPRRKGLRPRS
jgi:hypothetical protein